MLFALVPFVLAAAVFVYLFTRHMGSIDTFDIADTMGQMRSLDSSVTAPTPTDSKPKSRAAAA